MKAICYRNFICNGIKGYPTKILSEEECEKIGSLGDQLVREGCVVLIDGEPTSELDSPAPPTPPAEQAGDAAGEPVAIEPTKEAPKPQYQGKKGKKGH